MGMKFVKPFLFIFGAAVAISSVYVTPSIAANGTGTDTTGTGAGTGTGTEAAATGTEAAGTGEGEGEKESAGGGNLLQVIADNTGGILEQVNNLPTYMQTLSEMALQWTTPDTSDATASIQSNFTTLGNLINQNLDTQSKLMPQVEQDMFGDSQKEAKKLPNYTDLLYSTVLSPPDESDASKKKKSANSAYNYIKNAGGITIPHIVPGPSWQGEEGVQNKYISLFNTTMAIESYNGYILGQQYADGNQFNTLQTTLITQATDAEKWFAQVASENIGWVLRQLLIYQSQVFILLTQLVQTQKQMVTAQAMTNSLLIINNMAYESSLVSSAQNRKQTSL